jgi:hypothetical protein
MVEETPESENPPVSKRLRLRNISTQRGICRAHLRVNNWLLAGLITQRVANSVHFGLAGMSRALAAETDAKLLERQDALERQLSSGGRMTQLIEHKHGLAEH